VASTAERIMLSTGNEVYIKGGPGFKPVVGQRYSAYRERSQLKTPDGELLGHLVEFLGYVKIKRVQKGKRTTAIITDSVAPIERGDWIGPVRRRYLRVRPRAADKSLKARIIATLRRGVFIGTDELVVVDKGRQDGVQVGNRFLVVQRGDGYQRLLMGHNIDAPKLPWEPVAEVTVVDARKRVSIGLVTRAIKEIQEGDHLRMRRGY